MAAKFNTLQNKEFLWKLMYETKLFEGLDNSMVGTIQNHFENKMAAMDMKKTKEDTLITLNKQIIQKMVKDIGKNNINNNNNNNTGTTNVLAIPNTKQMITAQDITQNRKEIFDIQLKTIQNDFDQMINAGKPNIIEFEDKNLQMNEAFAENSTIEKLLAETIAKRKDMLININSADINKASKWLNREEDSIEKELSLSPSTQRKPLKIRYENLEQMDIIIDSPSPLPPLPPTFEEETNSALVLPNKKNKNVSFAESIPIDIDVLTSSLDNNYKNNTGLLQSAGLQSAGLQSAGLQSAGLQSAGLQSAGLQSAGLQSAGLQSAGLQSAGRQSAGLQSAGLQSAGLQSAGLQSADFNSTSIKNIHIELQEIKEKLNLIINILEKN
jgi:hypothetical protein